MTLSQEPLVRLDSSAVSEVTLPTGLVRETHLNIGVRVWRSPGGYPVCLDAEHGFFRHVQEMHLSSLPQVVAWIGFQASPLSKGLLLSGEAPYRIGMQLESLARKLLEWGQTHPEGPLESPHRSPVFFFEEAPTNARGSAAIDFGTIHREVGLTVGFLETTKGIRVRLAATMDLQRTTLEATYGNTDAIRRWLGQAGTQLAGAANAGGLGDKVFQSVIGGSFVPALGRFDGCRTQPVTVATANALRTSVGRPPLPANGPIPLAAAPKETVIFSSGSYRSVRPQEQTPDTSHVFSDTTINH